MKNWIAEPLLWVGLGAVLFCAGWGLAYLEDHRLAEAVREEQDRLPEPVFVQAYDPDRDANAFGEVSLIGEVDFTRTAVVELGSGRRLALLVVHDVTPGGRRAGERRILDVIGSGGVAPAHRPVPRRADPRDAMSGVLVVCELEDANTGPDGFGLHELGAGFHGTVVHLSGRIETSYLGDAQTRRAIETAATGLGAGMTTGGLTLVSPFGTGQGVAFSHRHLAHPADWKMWIGALMILAGILMAIRASGGAARRPLAARRPKPGTKNTEAPRFGLFAPIASQDDLGQEASTPAFVAGLLDATAARLGALAGYLSGLRNRR